MVHTLTWLRCS
jgi:2A0303: cationic amino acid transport permease